MIKGFEYGPIYVQVMLTVEPTNQTLDFVGLVTTISEPCMTTNEDIFAEDWLASFLYDSEFVHHIDATVQAPMNKRKSTVVMHDFGFPFIMWRMSFQTSLNAPVHSCSRSRSRTIYRSIDFSLINGNRAGEASKQRRGLE